MASTAYTFDAADMRALGAIILNLQTTAAYKVAAPYLTIVNHDSGYTLVVVTR